MILIVEDDADVRAAIVDALSSDGHRCIAVENGEQALGAMAVQLPYVVVTDLLMPVRCGRQLLERMHMCQRLRRVPVCILTADPGMAPPGVPILRKPFDVRELRRTVRMMIVERSRT